MIPLQLFDPASSTYTYILHDSATREALIIDPVDAQLERDLAVLQARGLTLRWAVETHNHADHITSAGLLAEHTGARTAAPAGCGIGTASMQLADGDTLAFGEESLRALATPGHTAGSMSYLWRGQVFTGDTLLINGCGRTDFQSGSAASLYQSIVTQLFTLPDDTIVYPGHDYQGKTQSSIGQEKQHNPRLAGKTAEQFIALMNDLQLPKPKLIDQAVPANLQLGLRHDAGAPPFTPEGYTGDVSPETAYDWWQNQAAALVDVRTDAERDWVGFIPDALVIAWQQSPDMRRNEHFDEQLSAQVAAGTKVLFLCRSGVRAVAAARRATELGYDAYNIAGGFEGDLNQNAQRGQVNGWRAASLPWRQG